MEVGRQRQLGHTHDGIAYWSKIWTKFNLSLYFTSEKIVVQGKDVQGSRPFNNAELRNFIVRMRA